jgi:pyruvate dehydrogenase E1 component
VNVIAMGSAVTEAAAAVHVLHGEEVAANLIVVSSADRLSAELHDSRLKGVRDRVGGNLRHLETLFPEGERHVPMVTVVDGASHSLSFLGSVYGAPVVPLGADTFGQSGTISDLYRYQGIDANHVIDAALLALDLA